MSTLLHVDSSPMGDYSISRHLSAEFVRDWQKANPGGRVVRLDLTATNIEPITGEWVSAAYTPKESRSEAQRAALWFAHIGLDRMLGYGLKYETAFKDTHLQRV